MEKGLTALSFCLKGNSPLERIHIPHLGQINQPIGLYTTPHIWGNQTLHEVNIRKEHLLKTNKFNPQKNYFEDQTKFLTPYLFYISCYIYEYQDKVYNNHTVF